jgi:hypothetical protein
MAEKRLIEFSWNLVIALIILAVVILFYLYFRFGPPEGPIASVVKFIGWVLGPIA